ncbi:hypothetical protein HW571_29410 [Agrobacterium genomosp. 3]|uniref:hypothetical protein n=1 Tax=Agrobacterium tomkonis TaxID=1183410 RepID=UPI001CD8845E|nr:hypothetical protein [Agrobacterium tomkonis]MCA1880042.1 hypothetical protein [Agrobacterium tumefaciens]MCA1895295.1 hypothetical protein [Agrobacterium tomkonis]
MDKRDIEKLEKVSGQIDGLHREISALVKKSPNDALNKFKLSFVNTALAEANAVLGSAYQPFASFTQFNEDDVPSNSDVAMILAQYLEELERKRADNLTRSAGLWVYEIDGKPSDIRTAAPKKLDSKK